MSTNLTLTILTGITFGPLIIMAKDGANVAIDLTGWQVWAEVRNKPGGIRFADLSPEITNPQAGEITISLTDEETSVLTAGMFSWDLILETPTGERIGPFIAGRCVITSPITAPTA